VASLTLNRPESRNALSQLMVRELAEAGMRLSEDPVVRVVILTGAGNVFCAGDDFKGLQQQSADSRDGRIATATEFAEALAALNHLPQPLIGRIDGSAFGNGLGLISVCDIAVGITEAKFRLTEATLGLVATVISPYLIARIGLQNTRRIMLTAYEFDGGTAYGMGLLDDVAYTREGLDIAIDTEVGNALSCAPQALASTKSLLRAVSRHLADEGLELTTRAFADVWESPEIHEGLDALAHKRPPTWQVPQKKPSKDSQTQE
jgi:methylglutaconyl-CoA hydratase